MLVLTRRIDESIVIDRAVTITVIRVRYDCVYLEIISNLRGRVFRRGPGGYIAIRTNQGDEIRIIVLQIHGYIVRLGIEAPRHVIVDRSEIDDAKRRDEIRENFTGWLSGNQD